MRRGVGKHKLTVTKTTSVSSLLSVYTHEQAISVIHRNFLRLSPHYSHIPRIQHTFKRYVNHRFRMGPSPSTSTSTSISSSSSSSVVARALNTLAFTNNACCYNHHPTSTNGDIPMPNRGNKEYTLLKNLVAMFHTGVLDDIVPDTGTGAGTSTGKGRDRSKGRGNRRGQDGDAEVREVRRCIQGLNDSLHLAF